jgi:uncharacterized protein
MSGRAVVEQVLGIENGVPSLAGTRCLSCGAVYFPAAISCRNPVCDAKSVEAKRILGRGTLYSFTIQRYRPPPLFAMEPWEPYALGLVDLDHGVRVMGMIADMPLEDICIGMALRLSTQGLHEAGDGPVITHVFVPVTGDRP